MAVAFVSVLASDTVADSSDTTLAFDVTGVADGDLMVLVLIINGPGARPFSLSGWTQLFTTTSGFQVLYRFASSDTGVKTFTCSTTYSYATGVMLRFSGAATPNVYTAETYDSAWDAPFSCTNITPATANSIVCWIGSANGGLCTSNRGTERFDNIGISNYSLCVYTEEVAATTEQTGAVLTRSAAINAKFAASFAIPPAAGASTPIPVFMNQYRQRVA